MILSKELTKKSGINQFQINKERSEIFFLDDDGNLWHADLNEYWNDQGITVEAKRIKFKGV
jgi:hypothetical protein